MSIRMTQAAQARHNDLYSQLQLTHDNEIRLVKVSPFQYGKDFCCDLVVIDLTNMPRYIALSYTWGPSSNEEAADGVTSDPTNSILCNGHAFSVTANLYNFLVRAAQSDELASNHMWIDILCINQEDLDERTQQVSLMTKIYQSAESVVAWLGEQDTGIGRAFDLMKTLGRCSKDELRLITPKTLQDDAVIKLLAPCHGIECWNLLAKFFKRRYFTRVWVIQEVTLAKQVLVLCGTYSIDWDEIAKVSRFLTLTSWTNWLSRGVVLEDTDERSSHHGVPTLLKANKRAMIQGDKNIMLWSLIRSRRFESFDPRDKVYALLGVAGNWIQGKSRYTPVYGERSVAETYTLAAIQILEDADDLFLLTVSEGDRFKNIPSLPSWVPDWSCARVLGLGVTGYKRFTAAGEIPRSLVIDERALSLTVSGMRLDTIISVGESKRKVLRGGSFPRWLAIFDIMPKIYHTGQSRFEVLWRTLITDTAGYPPTCPSPPHYANTFLPWIERKLETFGKGSNLIRESLGSIENNSSSPADALGKPS